ncbi:uncharacterized protein EI97DRAFT_385304 [Westerdykella ornata]|uniref:Uncharacterized protein n=1 Tax=Westerdykella ornata TaxID=318751 RepID=A0A6A6JBV6_WESOR|nr:uncharacterized protein EI97DRAFT_385304 [Westerdykella ornata]KAF2272669.1 hypothetical protein EI97DRAFT_385304 [Westerdykella ornata]
MSPPPVHSPGDQHPQQPPPSSEPPPDPTGFIAELPADMGSLSISEPAKPESRPPSTPAQASSSPYQAYKPSDDNQSSPQQGFTVPRRAVSISNAPLADPWRIADPATELPTREFYILADLIFDALDQRYEPKGTGLLEASKILESWKAQQLPEEVARKSTFSHLTSHTLLASRA